MGFDVKDFTEKMIKPLNERWAGLDKKKRIRLSVVVAVVLLLTVTFVALFTRQEYSVLYSNLTSKEAGEVLTRLDAMKINAKTEGEGTILVPKKVESSTRMLLAAEGYPKTGMNYESYTSAVSGLGTTESDKQRLWNVQSEERLREAILSMEQVEDAVVRLSMPESNTYALKGNKQEASVAVLLKLRQGAQLSQNQVKAIESLIATSVLDLKPENISIVDSNMNKLNKAPSELSSTGMASDQLEIEKKAQEDLKNEVLALLEPVYGYGNVSAAVALKLDFDEKESESKTVTPVTGSTGIPVSVSESTAKSSGRSDSGNVGLDPNGGLAEVVGASGGETSSHASSESLINYEVNSIIEHIKQAQASVKDLSVSVIIDSNSAAPAAAEGVTTLVANAVGISPEKVFVTYMPFSGRNAINDMFASKKAVPTMQQVVLYAGLAMLLIILLLVCYKFMRDKQYAEEMSYENLNVMYGTGVRGTDEGDGQEEPEELTGAEYYRMQINKQINENPQMAAQVLRSWLASSK